MKTVVNTSYWKEMLDAIPELVFAFRIDSNEEIPLVYVNKASQRYLGYQPEQYVLLSEEQTRVSNELSVLIDQLAEKSSKPTEERKGEISLSNNIGEQVHFSYRFDLYQTAQRDKMIILLLREPDVSADTGISRQVARPPFVVCSPSFKSIMDRLPELAKSRNNIWISGEMGVGKRTIAEKLALLIGQPILQVDATIDKDLMPLLEPHLITESGITLMLREPGNFSKENQEYLVQWTKQRLKLGSSLTYIVIAQQSAERLLESGKLMESLVYPMIYQQVLIPPLRARREDAEELTKRSLYEYSRALGIPLEFTASDVEEVVRRLPSTANFPELVEMVRGLVLHAQQGKLVWSQKTEASQANLFQEEQQSSQKRFLSYDRMVANYLKEVLKHTEGKIYGADGAAGILKMKPTTLQSKLKKLGIK